MAEARSRADWSQTSILLYTLRQGLTPKKTGDWTLAECTPWPDKAAARTATVVIDDDPKLGFALLKKVLLGK